MAGLFGGKPFDSEDMAQVAAAPGAEDLDASTVGVEELLERTGESFIEARSAGAAVKLGA